MTKLADPSESNENKSVYDQPMSSLMLLSSHSRPEEIIDQIKKNNDDTGVMIEVMDFYGQGNHIGPAMKRIKPSEAKGIIDYRSMIKEKNLRWLAQTTNHKGEFHSLHSLIKKEIITDAERELYTFPENISEFPYRQIYQIFRYKKSDDTEWFSTNEMWVGIDQNGTVIQISVPDLHTYLLPKNHTRTYQYGWNTIVTRSQTRCHHSKNSKDHRTSLRRIRC